MPSNCNFSSISAKSRSYYWTGNHHKTGFYQPPSSPSYNACPSSSQLQQSSNVLLNPLGMTSRPLTALQIHPQAPGQARLLSQMSSQSNSFYSNATFTKMLSGCLIGSIQVVVKPCGGLDEVRAKKQSLTPSFLSIWPSYFALFLGQICMTVTFGVSACMSNIVEQ